MSNNLDKATSLARDFTRNAHHYVSAIIVAAGSGTRMGGDIPKQFLPLNGRPLIINTLSAFEESPYVNEIVLVVRESDLEVYPHLLKTCGINKVRKIVCGGQTRQQSVLNGLDNISDKADYVAIHDGARPLVTEEIIKKVILAAFNYKAATAATKCKDTPKFVTDKGYIEKGINRDSIMLMQTPQAFGTNMYRAAAYTAIRDKFEASDDCALAEHAGFPVMTVDCGPENFKITTPEDLMLAEIIMNERRPIDDD